MRSDWDTYIVHPWGLGELQAEHCQKIRKRKGARGSKMREPVMTALQHERKADFGEFLTETSNCSIGITRFLSVGGN